MQHFCPHCHGEIAPGALLKKRAPKRQPQLTKPPSKPNARGRIWQSMRMCPRFTRPEVQATAEASEANVGHMVRALMSCGYVRCVHESTGATGDHSVYQLIRNTGPHCPRLRAKGLYDLNTKQEVGHVE